MPCTWPLRTVPLATAASAGAPAGGAGAPGGAGDRDWQALLTALGLAPTDLEGAGGAPSEEEAAAAALVRLHFYAGDPGPLVFPRVALRLLELLLEEEVDVAELCRLVELDAALAGAVLARANAAAARSLDPILGVPHAVTRLGTSEVARVAAAAALRALYAERARAAAPGALTPLWPLLFRHAVTTGRLAAELARGREGRGPGPELAFTAGLLHDVGLAVALRSLSALTQDGTLALREPDSALRVVLRAHVELGEEAARGWALPAPLAEVVARHHAPPAGEPPLVQVVALASALDLLGAAPALAAGSAREAVAAALSLDASPAWLAAAVARREEAEAWTQRAFAAL